MHAQFFFLANIASFQAISQIPTPVSSRPQARMSQNTETSSSKHSQGNNIGIKPPCYSKRLESSGPAVTVFVGNITEKAPDVMVRHILNTCGNVHSWKRVQGASGKLQGNNACVKFCISV